MDTRLLRITPQTMRAAHAQVAVQRPAGHDVYLYRESGFPELAGADTLHRGARHAGQEPARRGP
ncbi:hypothetical protein [Streptomyces sp. KL116D]|uniref:hypothetical protein n=1 Tax=Streptomyces sp. KL116D TaxID=3045152 RepID=UPI003558C624